MNPILSPNTLYTGLLVFRAVAGPRNLARSVKSRDIEVTVQFETEGNGQNEIFIHMDRSEVKP